MSIRDQFPKIAARHVPPLDLDAVDDELPSNYIRAALVEGLQKFAPSVRVDAFANVRLIAAEFDDGLFDVHAAEILVRIQNEIDAVTDEKDRQQVQVGFNRLGQGSVVMHLNPVPPIPPKDGQLPISAPPVLESALMRILDLHDAFEAGDTNLVAERAKSDLAARARQLVETLDEVSAAIEIDLSRSDGRRRQSRLTEVGRGHARVFFERQSSAEEVLVSGVLHTSSVTGNIEMAVGKKVVAVSDVPADVAKALQWDRPYRLIVMRTIEVAQAGRKPKVRNRFVRILEHDEI